MEACLTCSVLTRKYKCSNCLQFCCSLPCYKSHKEQAKCSDHKLLDKDQTKSKPTGDDEFVEPQRLQMFTTDDTVDPAKLKELGNSERLRQLLHNPHLREYIAQLDTTPDAWKAMKIAMLEPLFIEFADECMQIVEPDDVQQASGSLSPRQEAVSQFCAAIVQQLDE